MIAYSIFIQKLDLVFLETNSVLAIKHTLIPVLGNNVRLGREHLARLFALHFVEVVSQLLSCLSRLRIDLLSIHLNTVTRLINPFFLKFHEIFMIFQFQSDLIWKISKLWMRLSPFISLFRTFYTITWGYFNYPKLFILKRMIYSPIKHLFT